MRPIPAPRLGDTHGLLRAISSRDRVRLDEFITEFSIEELFPPGLENALGRTRQFVSFARSAGLLKEDRGVVELTEVGKRYVRSGDDGAIFDVSPGQAEWLRRQLFERHMTDSIYHGAAIGLSLYASSPADFRVSRLDFGRALAHLGRAGWDNENTLESQGERYTTFLRDLELLDQQSRLTEIGNQTKSELTLPVHMSLRDLAGQLNPGGLDAATAEGEAEWAAADGAAAEPEPAAEPAPVAAEQAPAPEAPAAIDTGEYEDVAGAAASRAGATEPSGRPIPPSDIWETAAPDEVTRAYSAISPEEAAAAAVTPAQGVGGEEAAVTPAEGPGEEAAADEPGGEAPAPAEEPGVQEPEGETPAAEETGAPPAMTSGDPLAPAGEDAPAAEAPVPVIEVPAGVADQDRGIEETAPDRRDEAALADEAAAAAMAAGVSEPPPSAAPAPAPAADEPATVDEAPAEGGVSAADGHAAIGEAAADEPAAGEAGVVDAGYEPAANGEAGWAAAVAGPGPGQDAVGAGPGAPDDSAVAEPSTEEAVGAGPGASVAGPTVDEAAVADAAGLADSAAAREAVGVEPVADEAALADSAAAREAVGAEPVADEAALADSAAAREAVGAEPVADEPAVAEPAADEAAVAAAAEEGAVAEAALAETSGPAPVAASTREPSGFLDAAAVKAAAEGDGLRLPDSVYAAVVAALATGKHVVIAGPAGAGKTTLALAVAKAAVQAGRSEGAALATASPKWSSHDTVGRVGESGFTHGHVLAAAARKKWLVIDEIDRAKLDKAFGDLSSFLGGLPLSLPDGSREVAAPKDWRIVATRDSGGGAAEASAALLRRFAEVHVPRPDQAALEAALDVAAEGDPTAAAVAKRLAADQSLSHLGAGPFLDAARHAAERNAISPASEDELERELRAAYIDPHLARQDD